MSAGARLWAALLIGGSGFLGGCVSINFRPGPPQTPRQRAEQCCLSGSMLESESLERAAKEYRKAIRVDPTYVDAHVALGRAVLYDDPPEAEREFREAIRLDPKSDFGYHWLGHALRGQGRYDEAVEAFKQDLARHPQEDVARGITYANIAQIREKQNRSDLAIQAWREAARLDPESAQNHERLSVLLAGKGADKEAARERELAHKYGGSG